MTSPILALYGVAPAYFFNAVPLAFFLKVSSGMSLGIFLFWNINIQILLRIKDRQSWQRYVLSYLIVLSIDFVFINIGTRYNIRPRSINRIYPFIAMTSINTFILFISNFIVLQTQKATADQEIEQLKVSNLEAQKQVLMQQLQPHFLFNALSTLKSLIGDNPRGAEEYTLRLSDFLRYSVKAKNNETISLAEELDFTENYINLQKVRFGESLQCTVNVPATHLGKKLPVYGLQTLVENAIKHNSFSDKKILTIGISIEKDRLAVKNNRHQKRLQHPSGTGLQNLNQRYQILANKEIEVFATESDFAVYLPIIEA